MIGSIVAVPGLQKEGPARIEGMKQGFIDIKFLDSGALMTSESRKIVRFVLFPKTKIVFRFKVRKGKAALPNKEGEIAQKLPITDKETGRIRYFVKVQGEEGVEIDEVDEFYIVSVLQDPNAFSQLSTIAFHDLKAKFGKGSSQIGVENWGPLTFSAREQLLSYRDSVWKETNGVSGLSGARVIPLPHQLLVAKKILSDHKIRYLLADEVGLGKTIEAGLVMQSLLAIRPTMRVLIIAPGALVSQWFLEIYSKFGSRTFTMIDDEKLSKTKECLWDNQFVLASARTIETLSSKESIKFASSKWDMIIVDECHRMQSDGPLYKRVSLLSKKTPHVLLLSATPNKAHSDAYLALLSLLQPDTYKLSGLKEFEWKLETYAKTMALIEETENCGEHSWKELKKVWTKFLGADSIIKKHCKDITDDFTKENIDSFLSYVNENYRLDHRIISNRRSVLMDLSKTTGIKKIPLATRSVEVIPYLPSKLERQLRVAMNEYREKILSLFIEEGKEINPRLAHWLLQLETAVWSHAGVLTKLTEMRATVLEEPSEYEEYRIMALKGETIDQILRPDFSESEQLTQIAVSATCNCKPSEEYQVLKNLHVTARKVQKQRSTSKLTALTLRIKSFWDEFPGEKIIVFVGHSLAVPIIADRIKNSLPGVGIETFGAHQDHLKREEAAKKFETNSNVNIMISDPLGGEGRNFQFVSVVVHYDLPWSIASVEQRIGRVDRLGRDGVVPSWLLYSDNEHSIDKSWALLLKDASKVFEESSSGLEFISGKFEAEALDTVLRHGPERLLEDKQKYIDMIQDEKDHIKEHKIKLFNKQKEEFVEANDLAEKVSLLRAPVRGICDWLRGIGGQIKRDEDIEGHFALRSRNSENFEDGTFDRRVALINKKISYFAYGHDLVDRLIQDANDSIWCKAIAWRRKKFEGMTGQWEGLRVSFELQLDMKPLFSNNMHLESLRRVFDKIETMRVVQFYKFPDCEQETDDKLLERLTPNFGRVKDDFSLSSRSCRDIWMKQIASGKMNQIIDWQKKVEKAEKVLKKRAKELWKEQKTDLVKLLKKQFENDDKIYKALADTAVERYGRGHVDTERLREEYDEANKHSSALLDCVKKASYDISSIAYIALV